MHHARFILATMASLSLSSTSFTLAQTSPPRQAVAAAATTAPSAVEDPLTFRFVQLASVEQSMAAVDAALKAAGYQAKIKTAQADQLDKGNELMDRKGGAPIPWDQFYGKTGKDFYMRDTAQVQVNARRGGANAQARVSVQSGRAQLVRRPPQMDYIYRANSEQAAKARDEVAALGGKIDKLLERRRQLETQQSALWARIAAAIVDALEIDQRALYANGLTSPEATDLPATAVQRAGAVQGLSQFIRMMDVTLSTMDDRINKDQLGALHLVEQNADKAQKDLARSISRLTDPAIAAEIQPLTSTAKLITALSNNAMEAAGAANDADQAGDELQKITNRGLLQTALADLADKVTALDAGINELAEKWRVQPAMNQPLPDVVLLEDPSQTAAPAPAVSAVAAPLPTAAPSASGVVDLLAGLRLPADIVSGDWKKIDRGIQSGTAGGKLKFPVKPMGDYDFAVSFIQDSTDLDLALVLTRSGKEFVWHQTGAAGGFGLINKRPYTQNRSTVKRNTTFMKGQRYTLLIQVRADSATALLDGLVVRELKTDYTDVSLDKAHSLGSADSIGLDSGNSTIILSAQYTPHGMR